MMKLFWSVAILVCTLMIAAAPFAADARPQLALPLVGVDSFRYFLCSNFRSYLCSEGIFRPRTIRPHIC